VTYNPNSFPSKNPSLGVYGHELEILKRKEHRPEKANPDVPPRSGEKDPTFNASQLLNNSPGQIVFRPKSPKADEQVKKEPIPAPVYAPGLYQDAFSRLGLLNIANICDLGCGAGNFTGIMAKNRQRPEVYLGVDNSHAQISVARAAYPGWNFIYGDFLNPQIWEQYERYEAFLLINVLDTLEDDLGLLSILPSEKPVLFSMPRSEKEGSVRFIDNQVDLKQRYGNLLNIRSVGRFRTPETVYSMVVGVRW
jgi:SAM-dependent methyltransferase